MSDEKNYFAGQGLLIAGLVHLSGSEALQAARDGALFLDLRSSLETDYKKFDVPEVLYIPADDLRARVGEIPSGRPVVVADSVGLRSKEAAKYLLEQEFTNVANLNGGILDWEHDGLPLVIDLNKQLSGSCTCRLKPRT